MDLCLQILDIKPQISLIKNNPKDNISIVFLYDNTHITISNLEKFISKSEKIHCRLNINKNNINKNKLNINSKIKLNNIDFTILENSTNIMGYGDIEPSTDIKWINVINNELNKNKNVIGSNLCQLQIKTVIKKVSNKPNNIFSASPGERNNKKTIYSSATSMKDNNEINNSLLTNSTLRDLENSFQLTNNNNNKNNNIIKKLPNKKTLKCFSPKNLNKKIGLSPLTPKLKNFNFPENKTTKHKRSYNRSTEHINYNQIYNDNSIVTNNIKTKMNNTHKNFYPNLKNKSNFNYNSSEKMLLNLNKNKLSYDLEKFNTIDNNKNNYKNKNSEKKIDPKILYKIIEDEIFDQNIKTEITKDDMILSSDDDIFNTKFKFNKQPVLKSATSSDSINYVKNSHFKNNANNYTSNNENDFENIKHDFILFYTKDYLKNIKNDSIKIELQLLLEKMFDIQNVFNKQFMLLYKNNIENKNLYKLYCEKYSILNKQDDKIKALKRKEKLKEYDRLYNKEFNKEIELKYIDLRKKETNIWNFSLNNCNNINNIKKENSFNEKKKNLVNIFLSIVENKQNKLSTLSKKFFIQLKTKYNNNNNNNIQKNNNKNYNSPTNKRKKTNNNNNNNGKEIGTPSTTYSPSSSIINYSKIINKNHIKKNK